MIKQAQILEILIHEIFTEYQSPDCFCCEGTDVVSVESLKSAADKIYSEIIKERRYLGNMVIDIYSIMFPCWVFTDLNQAYTTITQELKKTKSEYDPEW